MSEVIDRITTRVILHNDYPHLIIDPILFILDLAMWEHQEKNVMTNDIHWV